MEIKEKNHSTVFLTETKKKGRKYLVIVCTARVQLRKEL
jgi:hypothetical protein